MQSTVADTKIKAKAKQPSSWTHANLAYMPFKFN